MELSIKVMLRKHYEADAMTCILKFFRKQFRSHEWIKQTHNQLHLSAFLTDIGQITYTGAKQKHARTWTIATVTF